ncbi:glutamate decarboxylase [Blyttiomyces helicus]|uniref:Glutamate decarboxylase n=1 Tax=Blyttiomyces helicus TaxID=388810 RepID=A0A4P9WM21_9FUNG|nr:glutamate decarboxylase [Blyttiomyces helicus]|eukprot:RKO93954.1 glutamate decarboxylase [Blyttiomyces helicus]
MDLPAPELHALLSRVVDTAVARHESLPTARAVPAAFPSRDAVPGVLPDEGVGAEQSLQEVYDEILPFLSNSAGPRFFGLITGGTTPAAMCADFLTTIYDQNTILHSPGDSIAASVEDRAVEMLADLFKLPQDEFTGVLTTGATASNILGLACGRQYAGRVHFGVDVAEDGMEGCGAFEVISNLPHASVVKAMGLVGIGRRRLRSCDLSVDSIETALRSVPPDVAPIVVVSSGEVNTGRLQPSLPEVSALCKKYRAWLHLDGAFGLFARCSPKYDHFTDGVELADSITTDLHKWLNVPYDSAVFFTRHERILRECFTTTAAYLAPPDHAYSTSLAPTHPMNRGIESSRRFRALPVYMTLRAYGRAGYAALVERTCAFAKHVGEWIAAQDELELLYAVDLCIVLFRGKGGRREGAEGNKALVSAINGGGALYVTGTVWDGVPAIRLAVVNYRTTDAEFDTVVKGLKEAALTLA